MSTSSSPRGVKFVGSHLHQLDDKGRLALPASFRREAADQRFILVQAYPPALTLYPEVGWLDVEERLRDLVARNPEARLYALSVTANAVEVAPDAQGRILVPARLKEAAGLDGQALLVGAMDRVEIWNPERFEAEVAGQSMQFQQQYASHVFR
ncbi:MAG: division/cell wall cluster transcriptional repressor MraZ [Longimicrobiales bacterium]